MLSGPEESNLVRAAAEGDGPAFARLYESYERRIFNYLLRLLGDRHEAEDATQDAFIKVMAKLPDLDQENLQFGAYLYTAARNAGYDVITKRKKMEPTGAVPEQAEAPFRGELSDLETDPERAALAGSQESAVQLANQKLPERQREVLALRELDGLSYDEIAGVMEMKSNAVAQLISRARIALRKEMRIGAAASVAFATADCERAHGEIACRQDGEVLEDGSWLDGHLADCANCRVASEEMAEAGVSYRAWAPVLPAAGVFREVMARASEVTGHDWSEVERPDPDPSVDDGLAREQPPASNVKRAALVGAGSVLVAALFAFLLLAEANAPERRGEIRQLIIKPASQGKKIERPGVRKAARRDRDRQQARAADRPEETTAIATTGGDDPGGQGSGPGNPRPSGGSPSGGGSGNPSNPSGGGQTPTNPTDPVEPSNPTTPTPTDPVDPVDPVDPTPTPPDPTPIPGGPGGITTPGGPTPG